MATAIPLAFEADELKGAIEKARRRETLTPREREILIRRGLEVADLTDEVPEGVDYDEEGALDPEQEDELLINLAVSDAHPEDVIPWEAVVPPRAKLAG